MKEKAADAVGPEGALRGSWGPVGLPQEWAEGLEVVRSPMRNGTCRADTTKDFHRIRSDHRTRTIRGENR